MVDLTKQKSAKTYILLHFELNHEKRYTVYVKVIFCCCLLQLSIIKKKLSFFRMPFFVFYSKIHFIICIPACDAKMQNTKF